MQQLIGKRPNLQFLEIDATSSSQFSQSANYLQAGEPVTILCEGLLMYLTLSEKQQVCANVREILQQHDGVWITSDFTSTISHRQSLQDGPAYQQLTQTISNLTGRSPDNDFQTLESARQFVYEQGFHLVEHSALNVMDQLSCLNILDIQAEEVKNMLAAQSIFVLTLTAAPTDI